MLRFLVRTLTIVTLMLACVSPCAQAQMRQDTVVSFVTVFPGSEIYELEGHSAIRIELPSGEDIAVNFGLFNFNAPNFVYRFVKGETDYMVGAYPWQYFLDSYAGTGRRITSQRIDMTGAQKEELLRLLGENLQPENRVYRYNYVLDNCATRPLRLVELAMGDSILLSPAPFESQPLLKPTFRNVMRLYHSNYPWYQFGIDLALGSGIDRPITRREMSFAPAELERQLAGATCGGRKLVAGEDAIVDTAPQSATDGPTPWYLTPMAVFSLLFVVSAIVTVRDIRRRKVCRIFDTILFSALGLVGLLLTFLIFVSSHEATSPNWLYLWLNPFCLIVPLFIWLKNGKKVVLRYQIINFAVLILLCALWPVIPQSANPAFFLIIGSELLRSGSYVFNELRVKS